MVQRNLWVSGGLMIGMLVAAVAALGADGPATRDPDDPAAQWTECGEPWAKGCEFLGLWGDPEKTPIGSYVRAPKGYAFLKHSHGSTEHIVVLRGRVTSAVEGGKEVVSLPGMYVEFESGVPHWARCEEACLMYNTYDKPPCSVKFHR